MNNKLEESMQSRRKAHVRQAANEELLLSVSFMFVRALDSSLCCKQKLDLHVAFLSSVLLLSFPSLVY